MRDTTISRMLRKGIVLATLLAGFVFRPAVAGAEGWPRQIVSGQWTVTMYQPQMESFKNDKLAARAAVSVAKKGAKEPVFGAVWLEARMATDYDARTIDLVDVRVTTVKFADATEAQKQNLRTLLETEIPKWDISDSLDRFLASIESVEKEKAQAENLKNDPPDIIYAEKPTVLILIDGEPKLKEIENSDLKYVVNTPFLIVLEPKSKMYFLKGAGYWYMATKATGPFAPAYDPPASILKLAEQAEAAAKAAAEKAAAAGQGADAAGQTAAPGAKQADDEAREAAEAPDGPPEVVVRTKPAEIIQTNGEPQFAALEGTELLYLQNTENSILMDINTQLYYVLLSGRWYSSPALGQGAKWSFVPFDKLPADFANIPANSEMGDVRVSVPGTEESKEALLENQIPQTAVVDRKTATVTVTYNGEPKFQPIEGTSMQYAANTDKSVLLIDKKYYCCENGIWFVASAAKGPWQVCDAVPASVKDIPPSSPVYNVKYVYVYDSTPEVVYVGYTPAYYGSYVYGPCVVYGTGWPYYPWYGPYYYPRPWTFGFGIHYSPWGGWGFSFGVTNGWISIGFGWGGHYGGWWGPMGYRPGYHHGYYHGYHHGYRAGYAAGRHVSHYDNNAYRRQSSGIRSTGARPSTRPAGGGGTGAGARPSTQPAGGRGGGASPAAGGGLTPSATTRTPNNVYADKNGDVYRKQGNDWQKRSGSGWLSDPSVKSGRSDLTKSAASRDRGTAKTNNYSSNRSMSRSGGGMSRGGGGRRR